MWQKLFFVAYLGFRVALSCESNAECQLNERCVACPDTLCIPQKCSERGTKVACPILGPDGRCPGKPRCICVDGFLKDDTSVNANGTCIPAKKCKQPSIRATYSESEPNTDEQICCGGGVHPPKCGKNEVYDDCKVINCRPKLCSELGFKLDCNKKCKPGCTCKDGYVRNYKGVCIPKKDCTSCGGEKRAQSGCGTNCGKRCAEAYGKPLPCPKICKFNACDCRDGFYYDDKEKKCVKKEDCKFDVGSIILKKFKTVYCPNTKPGECDLSGCLCNTGYLRNATGACVPKIQCPPPKCPPGQVWSKCPSIPCKGDNCPESRYARQDCPIGIQCSPPRCVCAVNRKKDKYGNCILIKKCPPFPCGKNEKYKACPSYCEMDKCRDYTNPQKCPLNKSLLRCRPTCICKEGYYRDDEGNCIPGWQCPIDKTT